MKIAIATIYKCYNYGTFYQAFGLYKYLKEQGYDCFFVPTDSKYNKKFRLHKQFNRDIKRDIFNLKLSLSYLKDWRLYNIGKPDSDYDLFIAGSDELWNIGNIYFWPADEYYGLNLKTDNAFSYASCVGGRNKEDFKEHENLLDGIRGLKSVSARDDATEDFLKTVTGKTEITRVIDPSFLVNWHEIEKSVTLKNYILVYTYDGSWGFSDEYIKATKEFAKKKGLPLVSVGFKNDWCDKVIPASPREFLGYLKNADFVVTDTFHGTAMSIQYNKQFVSMGRGKKKVESLLKEFGITDRLYSNVNTFDEITKTQIDYKKVNEKVNEKIKISKAYLEKNING